MNIIVAFPSPIGSVDQPTPAEMKSFADFESQVLPPPNPVRNLENSLTAAQQRGLAFSPARVPPTAPTPRSWMPW